MTEEIHKNGNSGEMTRTILVTGLTTTEAAISLEKGNDLPDFCYHCRREDGSRSIYYDSKASKPRITEELELYRIEKKFDGVIMSYFICFDCAIFLNVISAQH